MAPLAREVCHLLFAYDIHLFLKACEGSANAARNALNDYNRALGQEVNVDKSLVFFGKGPSNELRNR